MDTLIRAKRQHAAMFTSGVRVIFKKYVYQLVYDLSQLVGTAIIYRSHKMYMKYILKVQNEQFSEEKWFILRATVKEV